MKFPLLVLIAFLLLILSPLHSQEEWRRLTTSDGLSSNVINLIYQARNDDIWIGTEKEVTRYNGVFEEGSLSNPVDSILEFPSGQIISRELVPSYARVRINLFDGLEWNEPDFLYDNDITVSDMPEFAVVDGGKLWISTLWDGLVSFDGQNWQLYGADVNTDWLVKTPDGRLWTGVWGIMNAIASFDGQKWNLEFDTDNSLLDATTTNTVLATSNGMILLGTDEGLFQYNPNLNKLFDLVLGKVNVNKILESRDGSIWVCAEEGKKKKEHRLLYAITGRSDFCTHCTKSDRNAYKLCSEASSTPYSLELCLR